MIRLSRAALSLLIEHTSTDPTRVDLRSVLFDERRGIVVSTDGHSLALMRLPEPTGRGSWLVGREQLEDALRLMQCRRRAPVAVVSSKAIRICGPEWKPRDKPVAVVPVRYVDANFPPFENVIGHDEPPENAFAVNPALMARALSGLDGVVGPRSCVAIRPHGALYPVEIAAHDHETGNEWLVVVMPMRAEEHDLRLGGRVAAAVKEASHG